MALGSDSGGLFYARKEPRMIVIRTAEDMARALDSPLDPDLHTSLQGHSERLADWDLPELAIFIIAQPGDTLEDLELDFGDRLVEDAMFTKAPELVCEHRDWIELIFILSDDGFGLVLLAHLGSDTDPLLTAACRHALEQSANHTAE